MNQNKLFLYVFIGFILRFTESFNLTITNDIEKFKYGNDSKNYSMDVMTEIPLYSQVYLIIDVNVDEFRQSGKENVNFIGFQLNFRSTLSDVVKVVKFTNETDYSQNSSTTLLKSDLYISAKNGALKNIFNVYPSPSLIFQKKSRYDDSVIESIWLLKGESIDFTSLNVDLILFFDDDTFVEQTKTIQVLVTQPQRIIDKMFYMVLPFLVVGISVLMGILLDTKVLIDIVKNPKPVIIGFLAQYLMMPALSLAIGFIFNYSTLNRLALFVIGCCPGSGASNQWTLLFDGDVNLSALMSFISTTASFFMLPLYFYTVGRLFTDALSIKIPFLHLTRSLALVVIPYGIGILISHKVKDATKFVQKIIKPIMVLMLLFFSTFGIFVNWYLIETINLRTCLTAPMLPFIGFLLGGFLAYIFGLKWSFVKTIGIEAGIQNTSIAFLIIFYSFPQPYATQAIMIPLVVALLTTKPFWIIYLIRRQRKKYLKRKAQEKENELEQTAVELQKL